MQTLVRPTFEDQLTGLNDQVHVRVLKHSHVAYTLAAHTDGWACGYALQVGFYIAQHIVGMLLARM